MKKINYQKLKVINKDFKFNDGKEHCRVFCKGFKKDISRDEITKIFETIGTIVDIRLPETREVSLPFGDKKNRVKLGVNWVAIKYGRSRVKMRRIVIHYRALHII